MAFWSFSPEASAAEFKDEMGRTVAVPENPQRIISLSPSITEILFALGLGDRVAGVTTWSDFPLEARNKPKIGAYVSPNLEQIMSLAPDLVIANREGNPPWVVEKLEKIGIPVFVHWPKDLENLPENIVNIAEICNVETEGRKLADNMAKDMNELKQKLAAARPVKTLLVIGNNPLVSVGKDTLHGKLLNIVKADNIAAGAPGSWPKLSLEFVLEMKPELVVVSTMERGINRDKEVAYWVNLPGLKSPDLRVASIDSDIIDRPGPRVVLGMKELARIVHPELF